MPIGFPPDFRNGNGGVAIGYNYDRAGEIYRRIVRRLHVGDRRRLAPCLRCRARRAARQSGALDVDGLQGERRVADRPRNEPPLASYFIDYIDGLPRTRRAVGSAPSPSGAIARRPSAQAS